MIAGVGITPARNPTMSRRGPPCSAGHALAGGLHRGEQRPRVFKQLPSGVRERDVAVVAVQQPCPELRVPASGSGG